MRVAGVAILLMLGAATVSGASTTIEGTVSWSGVLSGGSAPRGHATIECDHPTRGNNVRLHAGGLAPGATYALSMVDYDRREKPLGVGGGQAKTDSHGWLDYSARLPQCPLSSTVVVMVRATGATPEQAPVLRGTLLQQ